MKLSTTSAGMVLAVAAAGMLGGCSEYGTRYSSMAATEQTVHCYGARIQLASATGGLVPKNT